MDLLVEPVELVQSFAAQLVGIGQHAVEPATEGTLVGIERRRGGTLAGQALLDGEDPAAVFDRGVQQRHRIRTKPALAGPAFGRAPGRDPARQQLGRHWPRNAKALGAFTAEAQQQLAVRFGLDALGHSTTAEGARQAEHAVEDGQVVGIVQHVAHEAAVDLQLRGRQPLQVAEG